MTHALPPITRLLQVMAKLRSRDGGCPWDLEQTYETIAPYTVEEAYEVADAIRRGDRADLREELGDLLFQVVYHAQIATEEGAFSFDDVAETITAKMIRRHPHVFGDADQRSAAGQTRHWEALKAAERAAKAKDGQPGVLDSVPVALPALTRAVKLQNRAARVGFDWPTLAPVLEKLREEITELEEEVHGASTERLTDELGDVLFVMANIARHLRVDPETALAHANAKFERRFRRVEALLAERGRTPQESNLPEMDALWDRAKAEERSKS